MKNFILFLFIFNALFSFAQETPLDIQEISAKNLEPGKCYFTELKEEKASEKQLLERSFIMEVIPPKYEDIELILSLHDFRSKLEDGRTNMRICISPAHVKLIRKEFSIHGFNTKDNPNSFAYCSIEIPAQYKTISEKNFDKDSITIIKRKLTEESKIIKTYVNAKPVDLTVNQYYFQGGYWNVPVEIYTRRGCGGRGYTIRNIQEKLVELGYDVEVNNIINDETKFALIHFQRKNGLEEGSLNLETLKKLGVMSF